MYNLIKIKRIIFLSGLYKYNVVCVLSDDDKKYIGLGCHLRTVNEWENDFWNNTNEFPNDNSEESNLRMFAFEVAKMWFKTIEK